MVGPAHAKRHGRPKGSSSKVLAVGDETYEVFQQRDGTLHIFRLQLVLVHPRTPHAQMIAKALGAEVPKRPPKKQKKGGRHA